MRCIAKRGYLFCTGIGIGTARLCALRNDRTRHWRVAASARSANPPDGGDGMVQPMGRVRLPPALISPPARLTDHAIVRVCGDDASDGIKEALGCALLGSGGRAAVMRRPQTGIVHRADRGGKDAGSSKVSTHLQAQHARPFDSSSSFHCDRRVCHARSGQLVRHVKSFRPPVIPRVNATSGSSCAEA